MIDPTKKADDLEVGFELDEAMARDVMGWRKDGVFWRDQATGVAPYSVMEWKPSTDLNLCRAALQKTRWYIELRGHEAAGCDYSARVWRNDGSNAFYDAKGHAAEAFCKAMIKAARNDRTAPVITG